MAADGAAAAGEAVGEGGAARGGAALGYVLVFGSALAWSFGGAIARFIEAPDIWTVVFWRSAFASAFILGFMIWRDGWRGTLALFRDMGLPGLFVAACFATAATAFVVALSYTTVAKVTLMSAGVPLLAALMAWLVFRERVSAATWVAIAVVIAGVAIMVSDSLTGAISPVGDGLAVLIAVSVAMATVTTRRFAHVRMTPAACLSAAMAMGFAATQAGGLAVSATDLGWLFAFGVLNLGLGLALFASGARLIPAAYAALIGTIEPLFSPVWVWLIHAEVPSVRTVVGGCIIFAALLAHLLLELSRNRAPAKPGVTGVQKPL